ncbi:hypothetical protein PVAP13_1KG266005 [Panicum virgatum]|uniref:Uncharacterized protein n=1 Tax=Panicum virgatum TaxID=38727 RepID=A0A8T0X9D7_PANVG|nr:hypothetical protein PVAP13_1KG266005 [Panicum virgatum]
MLALGRSLNKRRCKTNMTNRLWRRTIAFFLTPGLNTSPFSFLFLLPEQFLSFPSWSTITPKVKIDIEARTNEVTKIVNHETHSFAGNREAKVSITLKSDMKTQCRAIQIRLKHEGNGVLRQAMKSGEQKERTIERRRGLMD